MFLQSIFYNYVYDNSDQLFDIIKSSYQYELLNNREKEIVQENDKALDISLCLSINDNSLNTIKIDDYSVTLKDFMSNRTQKELFNPLGCIKIEKKVMRTVMIERIPTVIETKQKLIRIFFDMTNHNDFDVSYNYIIAKINGRGYFDDTNGKNNSDILNKLNECFTVNGSEAKSVLTYDDKPYIDIEYEDNSEDLIIVNYQPKNYVFYKYKFISDEFKSKIENSNGRIDNTTNDDEKYTRMEDNLINAGIDYDYDTFGLQDKSNKKLKFVGTAEDYNSDKKKEISQKFYEQQQQRKTESLRGLGINLKIKPKYPNILQKFSFKIDKQKSTDCYATIGEKGFTTICLMTSKEKFNDISNIEVINQYGFKTIFHEISHESKYKFNSIHEDKHEEYIYHYNLSYNSNVNIVALSPYDKITITLKDTTTILCQNNILFYNNIHKLYNKINSKKLLEDISNNIVMWWTKIRFSNIKDEQYNTSYITPMYGKVNSNNNLYKLCPYFDFVYFNIIPKLSLADISNCIGDGIGKNIQQLNKYAVKDQNNIPIYGSKKIQDPTKININMSEITDKNYFGTGELPESRRIYGIKNTSFVQHFYNYNIIRKPSKLFQQIAWYINKDNIFKSYNTIKDYNNEMVERFMRSPLYTDISNSLNNISINNWDDIVYDNICLHHEKSTSTIKIKNSKIENDIISIKNICNNILEKLRYINYNFQVNVINPEKPPNISTSDLSYNYNGQTINVVDDNNKRLSQLLDNPNNFVDIDYFAKNVDI